MTVVVIGKTGQLGRSLLEAAPQHGLTVRGIGRSDLDLVDGTSVERAIVRMAPTVVVNAAAYTAVDKAEAEPDVARLINAVAPGHLASACAGLGIPLIHVSTDYVFDGNKDGPYSEGDAVCPVSVYGRTKLEGEEKVASGCRHHVILRTAWLFSPFGHNFVRTMLRLAETRSEVAVVDDQRGCPTYGPHLADAVLSIASRVSLGGPEQGRPWGIYHAVCSGETTWCGLAREVFRHSAQHRGRFVRVKPITTAEYPTAARRPANSRLDTLKLARTFNLRLPDWQTGVESCVARLLTPERCPSAPTAGELI